MSIRVVDKFTQNENLIRQIQDASRKGDDVLLAKILKSLPKGICRVLVNKSDKEGYTPLLSSAYSKSARGVQRLLKAGANPLHKNARRENFLHISANRGCSELIEVFLKSVPKNITKALINSSDKDGHTPLLSSAYSKSARRVQRLLKAGANPLHKNARRENFLHISANRGCSELIEVFLKSVPKNITKALINSSDKNGDTPLLSAAYSKSARGVQRLLKGGASPLHKNAKRENFLHISVNRGCPELTEVFLKSVSKNITKVLINSSDKDGDTPLLSSVYSKSARRVQRLLKVGANPLHKNAKKENFLHVSAHLGCSNLIEVFLKSVSKNITKALINSSDKDGDTPLLSGAYSKSSRGVPLLLKAGANPLHKNAKGENFLHISAYLGCSELIEVFLKSVPKDLVKASVNSSDKNGDTPLHHCIRTTESRNAKECAQLLLKAKANPLICDREGSFPYVEAMENGCTAMVRLLAKNDPKQKGIFALLNLEFAFGRELNPILFGKKVVFPGSKNKFWSEYISSTLKKTAICKKILSCCTQEQCEELQQVFTISSKKNPRIEKVVQKIRQGKLVIVPAGWKDHGISLVFRDGYLIVCNRGKGCIDKNGKDRTFFIRKISSNLMTKELLKRFDVTNDAPARKGIKFFYKDLPRALDAKEDAFCQTILAIAPKKAKADTCAYTCMKAALRASLALTTKDPKAARDIAKAWATTHRESALELFRKTPSPFDKAFRKKTIDAMSDRLKKRKRVLTI